METRWKKRGYSKQNKSLIDRILDVRGLPEDKVKREVFLNPRRTDLYDPKLLPDIEIARERILEALEKRERITVYSDYDCDGTIGAAVLIRYLKRLGADINYYIPNRLKEGYGLNFEAIDEVAARGSSLIITVDNGISSLEEAHYIKNKGIDLIVTDHHEEQEELPEALAVIDCKRSDSKYPYREICGAAVALKLVYALEERLKSGYNLDELIEMVMIAVVADVVPLVDENRTLVKLGLESFDKTGFIHKGLNRLFRLTEAENLTSGIIGFKLAPAINAAGRLGEVDDVMALLLDEDVKKAEILFSKNERRIEIEEELVEEALEIIKNKKLYQDDIIIVEGENWHTGVIGIVASRIQEYWNRPVIIIGYDEDGFGRGSCRSISGFNIFSALSSTGDVFESFGGHSLAAGFSIKKERAGEMKENLKNYTNQINMKELFIKEYVYDLDIDPVGLSLEDVESLNSLEPFGIGNPAPLFKCRIGRLSNVRTIGKDKKHLSFLADGIRSIAFNKAIEFKNNLNEPLTILAKAEINCYNNRKKLQLNVKDIKLSPFSSFSIADEFLSKDLSPRALLEAFDEFESNPVIHLERKILVFLYNLIRKTLKQGFKPQEYTNFTEENVLTLAIGLRILNEAELIDYKYENDRIMCKLLPAVEKKDLTKTPTYRRMLSVKEILEDEL